MPRFRKTPNSCYFSAYSSFADWGLLLAQLGSLGEIWHRLQFGANIGVALALTIFLLGILADALMGLAERLAESRG